MRHNALRAALTALLFATTGFGSASAGGGSALNVLGFSPDGRYFAFEQYGESNGPGAPYTSIAAIEVASNRLVKGFPLAASLDSQEPNGNKDPHDKLLAQVRAKAATDATPLLKTLGVSTPGRLIVSPGKSRARAMLDSDSVRVARQAATSTVTLPRDRFGRGAQLVLKEFDVALPRCKDLVSEGHPNGFGLTFERKGRPTIHLSRDQTIPAARGCPDRYGIAEVHALALPDGSTALAVLVQYFYQAHEGPDRRFLAVTGRIK